MNPFKKGNSAVFQIGTQRACMAGSYWTNQGGKLLLYYPG